MNRGSQSSESAKSVLLLGSFFVIPLLVQTLPIHAQVASPGSPPSITLESSDTVAGPEPQPELRTTHDKWNNFLRETASPLTFGGGTFNTFFSQVTQTDPQYGRGGGALAERFGASVADIATQNFSAILWWLRRSVKTRGITEKARAVRFCTEPATLSAAPL